MNAQNWQPVFPGNKYNYAITGSSKYATINIDSTSGTTVFLNKIVVPCDTCSYIHLQNYLYDTTYVWINKGSFLQEKIQNLGNTNFNFSGSKNLLLKLNQPLNSTWLYDAANAVQASSIYKGTKTVLGISDSVNIILLSTSDSIIISKNHGIVKFPLNYAQYTSYNLVGIEGATLGFQMPRFSNFFNFNVGDVFQYQTTDDDYSFLPPKFKRGAEKRTVLTKQVLSNGVKYQMRVIKVDSIRFGNSTPYYIRSDSTKTYTYIDSINDFTNLYPEQIVHFNNSFTNTFLDTLISNVECELSSDHNIIKRMGVVCPAVKASKPNNPYGVAKYTHSIKNLYLAMNSELVFGREAKEGFGIISELYNNFDLLKESCLSASIKNGDTTGSILDDEAILSINTVKNENPISVYPNPANAFFTVYDEDDTGNLYLYNSIGELVLSLKESRQMPINTAGLAEGVYVLISDKKEKRYYTKISILHNR